ILYFELVVRRKMSESEIPEQLRNVVVKRSKRDALGQIVVRRMSGLDVSPASNVLRRFEAVTEGKDDIAEKLEAVQGSLSKEGQHFLSLIKDKKEGRKSVAHLVAEAGWRPLAAMEAYAKGAIALGKLEAATLAAKEQPAIVKDLMRHALDQTDVCMTCVGAGRVPRAPGQTKEKDVCPACEGRGKRLTISEHKEFSMGKLLEYTQMIPKAGGMNVNVQQNVGVKVDGGGSFMAKVLRANEEVLYGREKVVEAEVVQSADNSEEQS
ncbi:MAG: hypothetical protein ACREIQ_08345, partial [Nitrospiria bacterium]